MRKFLHPTVASSHLGPYILKRDLLKHTEFVILPYGESKFHSHVQ
jgi:hypothetical protein